MSYVTSRDGTRIGYETTGAGATVILVDGALAYRDHRGGRELAAALAPRFSVVTYDRRGRGESTDTPPYAVEREIEDLAALLTAAGAPACLYGFSSGAVLALRAAAALGERVRKLALLEPPFGADDADAKREARAFTAEMARRLAAGRHADAVTFFLQDMVPPDLLENLPRSPDWPKLTAVAPTLAYENELLGDGAGPTALAAKVTTPALVLVGADSPPFKHAAAAALARALPRAERWTLSGQNTLVPPDVLAPILTPFFAAA